MKININGFIVTDALWFNRNPLCSLGIILGTTQDGRKEAYIGNSKKNNEKEDIEYIAKNGSRFNLKIANKILAHLYVVQKEE